MYNDVKIPGQAKPIMWLEAQLNTNIFVYIMLSMVTFGIYPIFFAFKLTRLLSELAGDIGKNDGALRVQLISSLVGAVGYIVSLFLSIYSPWFVLLSVICLIVAAVQSVRWAYKARSMMVDYYAEVHKFPVRINGFLLFFFANFMLIIAANGLERAKKLHDHMR